MCSLALSRQPTSPREPTVSSWLVPLKSRTKKGEQLFTGMGFARFANIVRLAYDKRHSLNWLSAFFSSLVKLS
jgi:hypothetical protein